MTGRHLDPELRDAYLLGDLDPELQAEMAAHVAECESCRESVAQLAGVLAAYRDGRPAVADEAALDRLLTSAQPRSRRRWVSVAVAAGMAAAIFMGGFWAGRSDVLQGESVRARIAPDEAPRAGRLQSDREPPTVTFAVADADLLGGLASRDTTWN